MSPNNQTLLARIAIATSVFALIMVAIVAATDGGSDGGGGGSSSGPVAVSLTEFAITPSTITVPQGGSLQVTNDGTMVHNVAVTDTDIQSPDWAAGEGGTVDLSSLEPGSYEIFCAIAGHKDSGMVGTLVITAEGEGGGGGGEVAASAAGGEDHAAHDVSSLVPGSKDANAASKQFEDDMDAGVQTFLEYAEKYGAGELETGNRRLEPEVLPDGTKKFSVTAAITDWEVSPGKVVKAWTYNEQVPGPWIKVNPGDKVQVEVTNNLPISTDVHWHGIDVPFEMDGLAPITQNYIQPFDTFSYEFTAPDYPQLGMYHAHHHGMEAVVNGLFAVIQVGEVDLSTARGRSFGNLEVPADVQVDQEIPMVLNDAGVIGLSLNGKAYPATEPVVANQGDWVLLHYYNEGLVGHPMHLHRQPHIVVAKDGVTLNEPYRTDTLWISPGERYSILIRADEVGQWAFHCHILSHAENDQGLFGMVTLMIVNDPNASAEAS